MRRLALFIHGLAGSGEKTWGLFPSLVRKDSDLCKEYDVALYEYPTRLLSLPFLHKNPRIQSLALGLQTELENRYQRYHDVVFICHSLGALVARQYLTEEIKIQRPIRISRLLMFAAPNNGADLAKVGKLLFWRHHQLRQLCRNSDFLDSVNNDWKNLDVEKRVDVKYVVGALDSVVDEASAKGYWGTKHCEVVVGKGHIDLVKPNTKHDTAFLIAKKFLLGEIKDKGAAKIILNIREDLLGTGIIFGLLHVRDGKDQVPDRGPLLNEELFFKEVDRRGNLEVTIRYTKNIGFQFKCFVDYKSASFERVKELLELSGFYGVTKGEGKPFRAWFLLREYSACETLDGIVNNFFYPA